MKITVDQLRRIIKEEVARSLREHDGGGPRRRSMDVIPADSTRLRDYILHNYEGVCADLGCDVSDPEFKEYVSDQLAGKVDRMALQQALAML